LTIIEVFLQRMAVYDLRPVDFSVLSLITHNPGITSKQLSSSLNILPPNLVAMVNGLEKKDMISRRPHPHDGRAMGLHLTDSGLEIMRNAERTAAELEISSTPNLSTSERKTLLRLLKKVYLKP
jgi:DNA-binding MarR family transcriptional regulator